MALQRKYYPGSDDHLHKLYVNQQMIAEAGVANFWLVQLENMLLLQNDKSLCMEEIRISALYDDCASNDVFENLPMYSKKRYFALEALSLQAIKKSASRSAQHMGSLTS